MKKYVHQFKQGDVVSFHGARFEILHDARESQGHRPQQGHLTAAHGPCAVAYTVGRWIDGQTVTGYFGPDDDWVFQGNVTSKQYDVNN